MFTHIIMFLKTIQQDTALTTYFSFLFIKLKMNNICLDIEEKRLHDVTDQPAKFSSSFYTD